jgi:hypothetical protein
MKDDKQVANEVNPAQVFAEAYGKLCQEHGYQIVAHPEYKLRDDGTFSTVLVMSVQKLA